MKLSLFQIIFNQKYLYCICNKAAHEVHLYQILLLRSVLIPLKRLKYSSEVYPFGQYEPCIFTAHFK